MFLSFFFLFGLLLLLPLEGGEFEELLINKFLRGLPALLFVNQLLEILYVFFHNFDGPTKVRSGLAQRTLVKECVIRVFGHQIREFTFDLTQV